MLEVSKTFDFNEAQVTLGNNFSIAITRWQSQDDSLHKVMNLLLNPRATQYFMSSKLTLVHGILSTNSLAKGQK